jgi:hypothetical protein
VEFIDFFWWVTQRVAAERWPCKSKQRAIAAAEQWPSGRRKLQKKVSAMLRGADLAVAHLHSSVD